MRLVYSLSIRLYTLVIAIASPFNNKANKWRRGRTKWEERYRSMLEPHGGAIWMHCASLGEFEQGRPILEKIRQEFPDKSIVLSFFSPSGFEVRKNWKGADAVIYLPADTQKNAKKLVELIQPEAAIWVKYEFWFNFFAELKSRNIPLYLVSGIFRKDQHFFKPFGGWQARQMKAIKHAFVQNEESKSLAARLEVSAEVSGDTRFDRVADIAAKSFSVEPVKTFAEGKLTLIVGSSWPKEEEMVARFLQEENPSIKVVIAPHEVDEGHLKQIESRFGDELVRYTKLTPESQERVLLIDQIGLLSRIYREGDLAIIGGGFGAGIHNTLEAAVFGLPILFGPKYLRFKEAVELIEKGGAVSFKNYESFKAQLSLWLQNEAERRESGAASGAYVQSQTGATDRIISFIGSELEWEKASIEKKA